MFYLMMRKIKELINDLEFIDRSRTEKRYFTRDNKLPFSDLMLYLLNFPKHTLKESSEIFFNLIGKDESITEEAISIARSHIHATAFRELFELTAKLALTESGEKWHGYRMLAVDGCKVILPSILLEPYFGHYGNEDKAFAQVSILYDVLNQWILDAQIEPISSAERDLAIDHIDAYLAMNPNEKTLIIFDRGYPGFELFEYLEKKGITYIMRVKEKFNTKFDAQTVPVKNYLLTREGHECVAVKCVKVVLKSKEIETLVTNLFDNRLGPKAFKELYYKRWAIEVKYGRLRHYMGMCDFAGRTVENIKQDFFATMCMANVVAAGAHTAQVLADEARKGKNNKYEYKINQNQESARIRDRFPKIMRTSDDVEFKKLLGALVAAISKSVTALRPERQNARVGTPSHHVTPMHLRLAA
jgi:hypothetical protein